MTDFRTELIGHRPELLRHCYRMLGSFADAEDLVQDVLLKAWNAKTSYAGQAPLSHWLMRIATNACLNELSARRRRGLPQIDIDAAAPSAPLELREAREWVTPAPDASLFTEPSQAAEARESVALAFIALLQRLPPRQRAVLLLKDVLGWSAAEVAASLELSLGSVNSALHRARQTLAAPSTPPASEPSPERVRAYLRSWEQHNVDAMVTLMRDDIVFAMPPHATWFRGPAAVERFLRGREFGERWAAGFRVLPTHANGNVAFAFYRRAAGVYLPSSLQVVRWVDDRIAELTAFVGPDYHRGFGLPEQLTG